MLTVNTAYDEEDDGFMFTRASKRAKSTPTEPQPAPIPDPAPKKTAKKRKERDEEPAATVKKPQGRKMSFSTPVAGNDTLTVPRKRKSTRESIGKEQNGESSTNQTTLQTDHDSVNLVGVSMADAMGNSMPEPDASKHSTVIALPFSDTPIITRNKELRKKGGSTRRSSLGLRGRRASSLIDNGHSAIPHREVETTEFYKHIEAEGLSEPRRMKQLLTWTGERALGDKPSHGDPDSAAALAGKEAKYRC
jgi:kinetochore protein Mis13/DSN1